MWLLAISAVILAILLIFWSHFNVLLMCSSVLLALGGFSQFATFIITFQSAISHPLIYCKVSIRGEELDRDPPKDPKVEIKFRNVGTGKLFIKKQAWLINGIEYQKLNGNLLPDDTWQITSETPTIAKNRVFGGDDSIVMLTVRPTTDIAAKDGGWFQDFKNNLQSNNVKLLIEYTLWDQCPFKSRLFTRSKQLGLE